MEWVRGGLIFEVLLFSVFWKDRFVNIIFVGFFLESCYAHGKMDDHVYIAYDSENRLKKH